MIITPPLLLPPPRGLSSERPSMVAPELHPFQILVLSDESSLVFTIIGGYVYGMADGQMKLNEVTLIGDPLLNPRNVEITTLPTRAVEAGKIYVKVTTDDEGEITACIADYFSDEAAIGDELNRFYLVGETDANGAVLKQYLRENIFFAVPFSPPHPFKLYYGLGPVGHASEGLKGVFVRYGIVRDEIPTNITPLIGATELSATLATNFLVCDEDEGGDIVIELTVDNAEWDFAVTGAEVKFYSDTTGLPTEDDELRIILIGRLEADGSVANTLQWSVQVERCGGTDNPMLHHPI
jgi:hypothetical protein